MVNELRNIIIFDYAANKRPIDEEFYTKIAELLKKHYGIEEYVKEVEFEPIDVPNTPSAYNTIKKTITVDMENMDAYLDEICSLLPAEFNTAEKETFRYLEAARLVFHELTHAIQNRDIDAEKIEKIPAGRRQIVAGVDPLFNGNLIYSVDKNGDDNAYTGIHKWNDYRDKRFGYNLVQERDAEIHSYTIAHKLVKGFDRVYPHLQKYMIVNIHKSSTMGYDVTENGSVRSPLHKYAKVLRKNNMIDPDYCTWFDEDIDEALGKSCITIPSLAERFKHGLPISRDEYIKVKAIQHKNAHEGYIISMYCPRVEQEVHSL